MSSGVTKDSSQSGDQEQVNPEELHVWQVREELIEDDDRYELCERVGCHVFEYSKGGDQSTSALPDRVVQKPGFFTKNPAQRV